MTTNNRAQLSFENASIRGLVTTVGSRCVKFADEAQILGLAPSEVSRLQRVIGLDQRYIVEDGETTVDLCENSARQLLEGCGVRADDIPALILVTPSSSTSPVR